MGATALIAICGGCGSLPGFGSFGGKAEGPRTVAAAETSTKTGSATERPAVPEAPKPAPPAVAAPPAAKPQAGAASATCADELRRRVSCSNPDEVCGILLKGRSPNAGANLDVFEIRTQDLGDGTEAWVFEHRGGSDAYAYRPSHHFVREGDRLVLVFDGGGVPVRYVADRPRMNGRWQIERTSVADITGLYRKRETERWFWTGSGYVKAFSRITIEGARDPSLNGTTLAWNPEAEELYRKASPNWTYKVAPGDTLTGIARRFGVSIEEIQEQNGIRDPGSLRLGQVLRYEGWRMNAR